MAVITISRLSGSGGDEIARKLARILNYRLFNQAMVEKTARAEGLSGSEMLRFADHYQVDTFLERLFRGDFYKLWSEDQAPAITDKQAQEMFQKAANAAHESGNVIIVGRGGQVMLQDQPDVLHVRIVAPNGPRIQRLQEEYALDNEQALEMIKARDKASAEYMKRVFETDWADPTLYHLILNTGKIDQATAIDLIIEAARKVLPSLQS